MKLFKLKKKKFFFKENNKKYKPYLINFDLKKNEKENSFNYR